MMASGDRWNGTSGQCRWCAAPYATGYTKGTTCGLPPDPGEDTERSTGARRLGAQWAWGRRGFWGADVESGWRKDKMMRLRVKWRESRGKGGVVA
jgi:hypothetical protein